MMNKKCIEYGHNYGDWQYESNESCTQVIKCVDCSYIKNHREKHLFSRTDPSDDCVGQKTCSRCKKTEGEKGHLWERKYEDCGCLRYIQHSYSHDAPDPDCPKCNGSGTRSFMECRICSKRENNY